MRLLTLLCASVALSGCVHGAALTMPFSHDAPTTHPIAIPKLPCSTPDVWSAEEFKALGKALTPLQDDPYITKQTLEWQRLRNEAKACEAINGSAGE